eukprot:TRINITY_DN73270_c0_g1_i1.p1 TRINITY_DN73270_c0_g1~~TRINITY_DN73270_c0_g1_i1.p1  ORF type:complete len:540 (-),score=98.79 TRINITY_DN73270_c0_g1_i1:265-1884(-)
MTRLIFTAGLLWQGLMCICFLQTETQGADTDLSTVAEFECDETISARNFEALRERLNAVETFLLSEANSTIDQDIFERLHAQAKHNRDSDREIAGLKDRLQGLELALADAQDRLRLLEAVATGYAQPWGWSAGQLLLLILAAMATLLHRQPEEQLKECKDELTAEGVMMDAAHRSSEDQVKASVDALGAQDVKEAELDQMMSEVMPIWELERRTTIWHQDWRAPFLPHDAQKSCKWMSIQDHYIPHPFISNITNIEDAAQCEAPPIKEVAFPGCIRSCSWKVHVDDSSDSNGWQYAVDFYLDDTRWSNRPEGFSHVRRRKWKPVFSTKELPTNSNSHTPEQPVRHSLQSALVADRALPPPRVVFEADLGIVPLDLLAANLKAEDWSDAHNVMMMYFDEAGIRCQEIGEWTAGVESDFKVQGKLRSLDMTVPVSPRPMCPAESHCVSTWHIASDKGTIILESIVMTLDVPYGKSFNVVKSDVFTLDKESGRTTMVRTMSFDWIQSVWAKGMIEAQVPKELHKDAEQWAKIVKRWAETAAK